MHWNSWLKAQFCTIQKPNKTLKEYFGYHALSCKHICAQLLQLFVQSLRVCPGTLNHPQILLVFNHVVWSFLGGSEFFCFEPPWIWTKLFRHGDAKRPSNTMRMHNNPKQDARAHQGYMANHMSKCLHWFVTPVPAASAIWLPFRSKTPSSNILVRCEITPRNLISPKKWSKLNLGLRPQLRRSPLSFLSTTRVKKRDSHSSNGTDEGKTLSAGSAPPLRCWKALTDSVIAGRSSTSPSVRCVSDDLPSCSGDFK